MQSYCIETKKEIRRMVKGLSHITFIVRDIEKATLFFKDIFHAKVIYDSGEQIFSLSQERFLMIGDLWIAIMKGNPLDEKTYNHIAFKIDDCDFEEYEKRVRDLGVEIRQPRSRIEGEGQSLYFYDYNNHLFELHTGKLEERLVKYKNNKTTIGDISDSPIYIKEANINQIDIVKEITCETIRTIYPHYYPKGAVTFFLNHHSETNIMKDITDGIVYLLENMENSIGTVTIKNNEICRLFVLPQYQGNGYGRMLMEFAEEKIAKQYEEILLDASLPAKNIYQIRGYCEVESKKILTENGDFLCYDVMKKSVI